MKPVALLICGALGTEVKAIVDARGWDVDIYGVPAMQHFYPKRIVASVARRLTELSARYRQGVVGYGDCGTAGALGPVLVKRRAPRGRGPRRSQMCSRAPAVPHLAVAQAG